MGRLLCCGEAFVLWGGFCIVGRLLCCGEAFVLWGGFCIVGRLLCCGEAGEKEKESARFPLPIVPRALSIFVDY